MKKITTLCLLFFLLSVSLNVIAQDKIAWLEEFTEEMAIGNDRYQYRFLNVDGNDCKIEIQELLTDKKGSLETQSWIFYLSDIDPATVHYSSKGKYIEIALQTRNSQEFISLFAEGEFEEYTNEIVLRLDEVDISRNFVEVFRDNASSCKESKTEYSSVSAAFDFLGENIKEAKDDDISRTQRFSKAEKPYLAKLSAESTDEDGDQESFEFLFNLADINPTGIKLQTSGRSLNIEVPVKGGEKYIQLDENGERQYTDELVIYSDDIENARQIINALHYLVSNIQVERKQWSSYSEAIAFLKENAGEVQIGDDLYKNMLEAENDPGAMLGLSVEKTDENGEKETKTFSFYAAHLTPKALLDVSRSEIGISLETKNKWEYVKESEGENITGYQSRITFFVSEIDIARDLMSALEYVIENSEEDIEEFTSVNDVNVWLSQNLVPLFGDDEKYEQSMMIYADRHNQIVFDQVVTEDDEETTTQFILYPRDISPEDLEIDVSAGKLNVPLKTDKDDFIKVIENEKQKDFTDDFNVYFSDPLVAQNFVAGIRYLKQNSEEEKETLMSESEARSFLMENMQNLEFEDESFEQKLEIQDEGNCKFRFTRVETDNDGEQEEFMYEFIISDIHEGNSEVKSGGNHIEIVLVTAGKEKLIKPYENGEVEDFQNEFSIFADDVMLAKKIRKAFGVLSEACK